MPRQYDQIETIAGSELRAHFIAIGAIRPKARPPTTPTRPSCLWDLIPTTAPATLLLDDAGRAAAERHIAAGKGLIVLRPALGLEGFMASSRPRVVRRGRRCA